MMKAIPVSLLVIPGTLLGSCAEPPVSRAEQLSYEVHIGMSETEVTEAIGHPHEIGQEPSDRMVVWTYRVSGGGFRRGTSRLNISFRNSVVVKVELLPRKDPLDDSVQFRDVD